MKKFNINTILLMLIVLLSGSALADNSAVVLVLLDGKKITVGEPRDKPLYLKFWTSWCHQCRQQIPHLKKLYKTYGDRIDIIAINPGWDQSLADFKKFTATHSIKLPVAFEPQGTTAHAFDVTVVPYNILFNRQGQIVYRGFNSGKDFEKIIKNLYESAD